MNRVLEFLDFAQPYRRRYGFVRGLRMAIQLRANYKLPTGTLFKVSVPDLPHPVTLRAGTSDEEVFQQLIIRRELDIPVEGTPRLIVDAGANIGLASVLLAARFPAATIVALEVDADNFRLLQANALRYSRIHPRLQGLWSGRGPLELHNPFGKASTFQVSPAPAAGPSTVEGIGMADLLNEFRVERVDVLKLDIEGAEVEVLSHGSDTWLSRVGLLVVELHDRYRPGCTDALDASILGRKVRREQHGEYAVIRFPSSP